MPVKTYNFKLKVNSSNDENTGKIAKVLQNITTKINEKQLLFLHDKIKKDPNFLKNAINKLDKLKAFI